MNANLSTTQTAMWELPALDSIFAWAALAILGLSGTLLVAEAVGFLPNTVSRWLARNRLAQTIEILKGFGIDVDDYRKRNRAAELDQTPGATAQQRVQKLLAKHKLKGPISVGRTVRLETDEYYDLMGASCDPSVARALARDLTAQMRAILEERSTTFEDRFSFVAAPKAGAPLLGAAFAQQMRLPLVLHVSEPKFSGAVEPFRARFDCAAVPAKGSRALIVDDSSTGGGKVIDLIEDLRSLGYDVQDVLVVFEPQLKAEDGSAAAQRLAPLNVRLHSIVKT